MADHDTDFIVGDERERRRPSAVVTKAAHQLNLWRRGVVVERANAAQWTASMAALSVAVSRRISIDDRRDADRD